MTPVEVEAEMAYRVTERLGIKHEDRKIRLSDYVEAENEAKAWLELARKEGLVE